MWVQPVGAQGRIEAFLAVGKPEQPTPVRPDRRRPCAQPVRDRAREVACGRRGRAQAPGRLLRRAGCVASWRRPTPRAASRGSGSPATRRCSPSPSSRRGDGPRRSRSPHRPLFAARGRVPDLRRTPTGSICCCRRGRVRARRAREGARSSASNRAARQARQPRRRRRGRPIAARGALRAPGLPPRRWQHAGFEDLGTYRLLLSHDRARRAACLRRRAARAARRVRRATTAESSCEPPGVPAAQRPVGDGRRRSCTCTATRCATGCARSRS